MSQQTQRKRKRPVLEAVQEDDGNSKFARALGSVDYHTREKGLQALTTWLCKKDDLSAQDLTRLWKGIFYCFWHADRAEFQVAYLYFTVFLNTMRREWFGIDRLRLDKFMMLVRKFVKALFLYLQAQQWGLEVVTHFMTYLQNDVMLSTDSHPAAGLTYHIADVFVVELKEVCRGGTPSADVLQALLEPFCQVLAKSNRAAFLPRLRESVFDAVIDEVVRPSEKMPLRHLAVEKLADHLFQLGASAETHAKNRQELYEVSKALEQAAKKRQTVAAKQGKNSSLSSKQKPGKKAGGSAVSEQLGSSAVHASPVGSDKHKAARASANGQANGSVESPDAFAKEALTALRQAAEDMPQAALTQMNGKQLKKLKKKQQGTVLAAAPTEQTSLSHQKLQAQLAGASEAVPLRLKQEKLAQRQLDVDLQDMNGSIQSDSLSHSKAAKKQKKQKQPSVLGDVTQQAASTSDNAATVAHASSGAASIADGSIQDGTASQKKRRVRFAMKRNLLMQIGGAVPPEEIRTPPGSRPKGSALKRSSLLDHRETQMNASGSKHKVQKHAKSGHTPKTAQAKLLF